MPLSEGAIAELSPLVLAYVGDAVWELFIRSTLVEEKGTNTHVSALHRFAAARVNADTQAKLTNALLARLTPEEQDVVRRGRNTRPGHSARSTGPGEYRLSTGFEALLGHMFLSGRTERLDEILKAALDLCEGGAGAGGTGETTSGE
ncbi:MAG: ribonuclease III [Firmicutes bacterium]|nr:ribonuclease III [Bacillota bacterium]